MPTDRSRSDRSRLGAALVAVVSFIAAVLVGVGVAGGTPARAEGVDTFSGADAATASAPGRRGTPVQLTEAPAPPPPSAHPVPDGSGTGRRVVYSKGQMRVWLIEADESVTRTYRVSGRLDQPNYGTYRVWSRSAVTHSRSSPDISMRWMVRFAFSRRGDNIGFHEIPMRNGRPMQSDDQLGLALSGGCVRQSTADAMFMWEWGVLGTVVVVVP